MGQNSSTIHPAQTDLKTSKLPEFHHSESFHGGPILTRPDGTLMSLQPLDQVIHRMPYYNPTDGFIEFDDKISQLVPEASKSVAKPLKIANLPYYNPSDGFFEYKVDHKIVSTPGKGTTANGPTHTFKLQATEPPKNISAQSNDTSSMVRPQKFIPPSIIDNTISAVQQERFVSPVVTTKGSDTTSTELKSDTSRGLCILPDFDSSYLVSYGNKTESDEHFDLTPVSERRKLFESEISNVTVPSPTNSVNMAKTHNFGKGTKYDWTKRNSPVPTYVGSTRSEIVVSPTTDNSSKVEIDEAILPVSKRIEQLKAISQDSISTSSNSPIPSPKFPTVKVQVANDSDTNSLDSPQMVQSRRSTDSDVGKPRSILQFPKSSDGTTVVAELHVRNVSPMEKRKVQFNGIVGSQYANLGKSETVPKPHTFNLSSNTAPVDSIGTWKTEQSYEINESLDSKPKFQVPKRTESRTNSLVTPIDSNSSESWTTAKSHLSDVHKQHNSTKNHSETKSRMDISWNPDQISLTSTPKHGSPMNLSHKSIKQSNSPGLSLDIVSPSYGGRANISTTNNVAVVQVRSLLPSAEVGEISLFMEESYNPGDLLQLRPKNSAERVEMFRQIFDIPTLDDLFVISGTEDELLQLPTTFDEFLFCQIDLSTSPSLEVMQRLWVETELPKQLHSVLESDVTYQLWVESSHPDIFTVLKTLIDHQVEIPPVSFFFVFWPRICTRFYRITSIEPGVVTFNWKPIRIGNRLGLASNYLKSLRPKDHITAEIQPTREIVTFAAKTPLVLIASGFDISALRWIWELRKRDSHGGSVSLIYNVKDSLSVLYGDELTARNSDGTISELLLFYGDYKSVAKQFHWDSSATRLVKQKLEANAQVFVSGPEEFCNDVLLWITRSVGIGNVVGASWFHVFSSSPA